MGVHLWMLALGAALMYHAGHGMIVEKKLNYSDTVLTLQALVQVIAGAVILLWGGVGDFKPIRISDGKKPRWEALHARQDFHLYRNRSRLFKPLLEGQMPTPPQ
mmetsp:Transcript_26034/g.60174  ORF Transcript_26034/g.60174 Transcript_26034/m.60174 type:complete len:104 (+) Transcript_26034:63-374(+)